MSAPSAAEPGHPAPGIGLSAKLAVMTTAATAAVVCLVFVALSLQTRSTTRRLFVRQLAQSQRTLAELQSQSLRQLLWTAALTTKSPTLRAAIATYRQEPNHHGETGRELLATLDREVQKAEADLGQDLIVVTDGDGRVLTASGPIGAVPERGAALGDVPAVRAALAVDPSPSTPPFALLELHGTPFQVGVVPIELDGYPIGTLLLGERLTGTFLHRLRDVFDGEVVVATPSHVVTSTVPATAAVTARFRALSGVAPADSVAGFTLRLDDEEYAAAWVPLGLDRAGEPVAVYLLRSITATLAGVEARLRRGFLIAGLLAVGLVGVGTVLLARGVLRPLGDFVGFMRSVGRSRDYRLRFDAAGEGPEIRSLAASYDRLIASLEEQHAELSLRSTELAATNEELREQIAERERAERALAESEEQLRQAQKLEAIGTLAGGVAHDFNNLLTVITGHNGFLLEKAEPGSELHQDLSMIQTASDRAASLTRQLLAFSRKQVVRLTVLDLNGVVRGVESLLRRLIGEDVAMRTATGTGPAWVEGDQSQLEQVLLNLAVNARDAMPSGGRLSIAVSVERPSRPEAYGRADELGTVLLEVTDDGIGMDRATQARIFEPFFTTKGPGRGTGLGLATVYGIVRQMGGEIGVSSEPGRGTRFRIRLPEAAPDDGPIDLPVIERPRLRGRETILVVEDEAPVRDLVVRNLTRHGYRVLSAPSGDEALTLLAGEPTAVDLLLTDVVMPGVSGRALHLALAERRPGLKVLFMSGYPDETIARQGLLDPGILLLEKPFTLELLLRRVREALDSPRRAAADALA